MSNFDNTDREKMNLNYNDDVFDKLKKLVNRKTGIVIKDTKKEMLFNRTMERLKALNMNDFEDYYAYLENSSDELNEYLNAVTTNLSYFFREHQQFDALNNLILPALCKKKKHIKIWSAGCSTGQEPYCLAILLLEYCHKHPGLSFDITATDLDTNVLAKAAKGIYSHNPMENDKNPYMPLINKYFMKGEGNNQGLIRVKPELKKYITYTQLNLIDESIKPKDLDIIFCRNVMIYFAADTQNKLINDFYRCLNPGAYLFIGHSETHHNNNKFKDLGKKIFQKEV